MVAVILQVQDLLHVLRLFLQLDHGQVVEDKGNLVLLGFL